VRPPAALRSATGTGPRFVLLMVLVTLSSVPLFEITFTVLTMDNTSGQGVIDCLFAAGFDPAASDSDNALRAMHRMDLLGKCLDEQSTSYSGVIATAVMLAVAGAVYWYQPKLRDLRRRSAPVETVDADGSLATELALLRTHAGLGPELSFHVDLARTTSGAYVHGRSGRYSVHLHAGLLVRRGIDPAGFRAVVLHELAHVRHRDVDYASASTALWRVFVVTALLPHLAQYGYALSLLALHRDSPWFPAAPWMVGFVLVALLLVGLVHLARADLLRKREFHADLRAVAWGADLAGWQRPEPAGGVLPSWRRFTALLRTHPGWEQRRRVLADPGRLDRLAPLEMFLTGASASLLHEAVAALPFMPRGQIALWISDGLVTLALCSVLGVQATRAAHKLDRIAGSGVLAGLWLGLGLLVGQFAVSSRYRVDLLPSSPQYLLAFLLVATVPMVWWTQILRLLAGLRGRRRRVALVVCALVAATTLLSGLLWWRLGGERITMGVGDPAGAFARAYTLSVHGDWQPYASDLAALSAGMSVLTPLHAQLLVSVAAILLWLTPLVLLLLQRAEARPEVRRTLAAGLAGGLVSWVVVVAVRYALATPRPADVQERTGAFLIVHLWWLIVTVMVVCMAAGALVAAFSRRHWMLRALVAAQVVQVFVYGAVFLSFAADGCLGPANAVSDNCHWHLRNGATAAYPVIRLTFTNAVLGAACAALLGAGAAWLLRRWRARPGAVVAPLPPPAAAAHRRVAALKAGVVLALCVPAVFLSVVAGTQPRPSDYTSNVARELAGADGSPGSPPGREKEATGPDDRKPERETPAVDPAIQQRQMYSWLHKGGIKRVRRFDTAVTSLYAEIERTRTRGAGKKKVLIEEKDFHRLCGDVRKQTDRTLDYFALPGKELQREWSAALSRVRTAARKCQEAMIPPKGLPKAPVKEREGDFTDSLHEVVRGVRDVTAAFKKITIEAGSKTDHRGRTGD
jgi:Zn-dependent protease with chaperone function